ncbi:TetR/AcrR family transcriptional regulator [Streptomyces acidicola]|uniref:TetR/AcrR family transcriptional regulator n=1 Tax=Streptomyces acidicola TaxID=2596892 RepID=UPI001D150978|nr:helix-turn-helix domain-containing protein [Streptomyces acidicola]
MRAVAKSDLTRRARLREAALELFAERGFEAISPRAVAAAAGLSPALVTRHTVLGWRSRQAAKTWESSANALNSRALPAGSRRNIVHCSPFWPSKRT